MAKFMIVDDSAVMRKNIRSILESEGHEVVAEAADGREVMVNYVSYRPDIVTMDISMGNMGGIEALQLLLRTYPTAKVVMVSAIGHKQQVLEAIKLGAKSYVVKPIERVRFLDIVNRVDAQS
ncbi:response regulator [Cohnella silvisoli]|uniref:Response regulator n=1 Tax=Cohnella silvisoli TaxID=2873699 RepID=A0ABV1KRP6_9BACL|nr:response regulator [Cohnella silvisoli]MCD9022174.1 response regulator [Cohnella silvisoli]